MRRIEQKLLWWRHTWFFHWAHKPLCAAHAQDVLRVGRLHLCRSCSVLWAGLALSAVLLCRVAPPLPALLLGFTLTFHVAAIGSHPALHPRWPRRVRDALRATGGVALGHALALLFLGHLYFALGAGLLLAVTYSVYVRLRRGELRAAEEGPSGQGQGRPPGPCVTCSEAGAGVCSGYTRQAQAIRAWEQSCSSRIMKSGFRPKPLDQQGP